MALADPMAGTVADRGERICRDIHTFAAEAVIISRIPGASHCAFEGQLLAEQIQQSCGIPVLEVEVPPLIDAMRPTLRTRFEAFVEMAKGRR